MQEVLYSQSQAARMLGISRGTLVKRIRNGDVKEYSKKPSKIAQSEIEMHSGVIVPLVAGQVSGNDDDLFSTDISKASEEEVKVIQARTTAIKTLEAVKKARRESGQLVKEESVVRLGELVRSKASQIADGIAIEVNGKTPAEVERIVTNRIRRYLKDMNEVPWSEFERI